MKKAWNSPNLTIHGTVKKITQEKIVVKRRGLGDDFASTISTIEVISPS